MCGGKSVSVTFGGVLVHRIVRQTARSITVVVPDRDVGKCDVVITPDTGGELYAISAPYAFTQLESAVITDMSPTFGCVGQVVEITGTNLLGDAADFRKITLAGIEADYKPRSGSQTSLTVRAREGPQGRSGPLVLQTTDGTTITGTYDWRYTSSVQLESITPNRGQTGTRAVLRGTNLLGGSKDSVKVTLGGCTVGKVVSQSNEEIVVIAARRGIFGKCDVEILTGSGERGKIVSGWEQLKDAFIEAADPVAGIKDTVVNIKGTNLLGTNCPSPSPPGAAAGATAEGGVAATPRVSHGQAQSPLTLRADRTQPPCVSLFLLSLYLPSLSGTWYRRGIAACR